MRCQNGRENYLGSSDGMYQAGGIGLVHQYLKNVNSCIYFHFSKIIDTNYVLGLRFEE